LGTWAVGGSDWDFGWGTKDDKESFAAIRRALELGVNWIDTVAIYGLGHAEEIVAQDIAGRRDEAIVAPSVACAGNQAARRHLANSTPPAYAKRPKRV